MSRPRLQDVAKTAKTSVSTVSRVLNGVMLNRISPATQQRVREAARELGFAFDPIARAMATRQSMTLGLSLTSLNDSSQSRFADALELRCHQAGFELLVGIERNDPLAELARLRQRRVDGLILVRSTTIRDPHNILPEMAAEGIPFACIGPQPAPGILAIDWDRQTALQTLGAQLIAAGARRILLIGHDDSPGMRMRKKGLAKAVDAHPGCSLNTGLIRDTLGNNTPTPPDIEKAVRNMLARRTPDAIVLQTERLVLASLAAIRELGLQAPRDLALACASPMPFAAWYQPQITTVEVDYDQMAATTIEQLKQRIRHNTPPPRDGTHLIPANIQLRQSTARTKP